MSTVYLFKDWNETGRNVKYTCIYVFEINMSSPKTVQTIVKGHKFTSIPPLYFKILFDININD